MRNDAQFYSGLVWLIGSIGLALYATVALSIGNLPGIEQLVVWLESLEGWWVLLAVFVAVFFEGLYFLGSFFPGTTIVLLLVLFAQAKSASLTLLTMAVLLLGWILSGAVNIALARRLSITTEVEVLVHDRLLTTWMPSFRSNYEVAQVVAGASPWLVFWSSVRVKVWATLAASLYVLTMSFFIDVTNVSNEEGFASLFLFVVIMATVGVYQVRQAYLVD